MLSWESSSYVRMILISADTSINEKNVCYVRGTIRNELTRKPFLVDCFCPSTATALGRYDLTCALADLSADV